LPAIGTPVWLARVARNATTPSSAWDGDTLRLVRSPVGGTTYVKRLAAVGVLGPQLVALAVAGVPHAVVTTRSAAPAVPLDGTTTDRRVGDTTENAAGRPPTVTLVVVESRVPSTWMVDVLKTGPDAGVRAVTVGAGRYVNVAPAALVPQ